MVCYINLAIDEAGKIFNRKIVSVFHGLIKLNLKNLVGSITPIKKTLWSLSQYGIYSGDVKNKYSLDLNVS
jgi:hypothetical protein